MSAQTSNTSSELEARVATLEDRLASVAEALGTLVRALEHGPLDEPRGSGTSRADGPAAAARLAHDLLIEAGFVTGRAPDRKAAGAS